MLPDTQRMELASDPSRNAQNLAGKSRNTFVLNVLVVTYTLHNCGTGTPLRGWYRAWTQRLSISDAKAVQIGVNIDNGI
jgi:ABC-type molybdate transport system substrate-binding protein